MNRVLRGADTRRAVLLALLALAVVVVAGSVGVVGLALTAGTSPSLVVPLLVLGLAAVPSVGRELALARRDEVALARLRGAGVPQVVGLLAVEPLAALLAGGALGYPLGLVVSASASSAWLDGGGWLPGAVTVPVALTAVAVGLAGVLVGTAGVVREPLADQVAAAGRPRRAGTGALFALVLVVVGSVVATYQSRLAGSATEPLALAAPALVGLSVGYAAAGLLRVVCRTALGATAGRGAGSFLAVRRLARSADGTGPVRLLVAAAVVAGLALGGAATVDAWADETARLRAGAALQVPFEGSAAAALRATRRLDPEGRWLMAATVATRGSRDTDRRAFVDAARLDRVSGDHLARTGAADVLSHAAAMRTGRVASLAAGQRLVAVGRGRGARPGTVVLGLDHVTADDVAATTTLRLHLDARGRLTGTAARVPGCAAGCSLQRLVVAPVPGSPSPQLSLSALRIGDRDLLAHGWRREHGAGNDGGQRGTVVFPGGLGITPALRAPVALVPEAARTTLPVLATDGTAASPPGAVVDGPGGNPRRADLLARVPALPLVEGVGVLADLPAALAGSPPTVATGRVLVLARADTPAGVLGRLAAAAGERPRDLAAVGAEVRAETGAAQASGYALVAAFAGLVALLAAAASARRRRAARRAEVAALRLLGLPRADLARATRAEVLLRAAFVAIAGAAGAWGASALLLPTMPLVRVPVAAVAFEPGATSPAVAVAAGAAGVAAGALAGLVGWRAARTRGSATRPAILREEVEA